MPNCRRCGNCCHVLVDNKLYKCKNLVRLHDGTTLCRNYRNRIGTIIKKPYLCGPRETSCFDYPNCEFNLNKEIAPEWK